MTNTNQKPAIKVLCGPSSQYRLACSLIAKNKVGSVVNEVFGKLPIRCDYCNGVYSPFRGQARIARISDKQAFFWKRPERRMMPKLPK